MTENSGSEPNTINALKMLGLARRSGVLLIGQDRVFTAKAGKLTMVTTDDCSGSVMRKLRHKVETGGCVHLTIKGITREEFGNYMGVASAQIAALPSDSGFAKKIAELLEQGGAHE